MIKPHVCIVIANKSISRAGEQMMKPMIGVLPLYDENKESYWMLPGYMKGIEEAGGIPVMLPLTAEPEILMNLAQMMDGFLFTGGHDVNPALYHEETLEVCGTPCQDRDAMESVLFQQILQLDKPALGICRGLQLFNVLLGGTLYQDLPLQFQSEARVIIEHKQKPPYSQPVHQVDVEKGTLLYDLLQTDTLRVNSYHHQGIKDLAKPLVAAATAEDGLIEAVVMPEQRFMMAVQWHPEFMYQEDEPSFKLFTAFVKACQGER